MQRYGNKQVGFSQKLGSGAQHHPAQCFGELGTIIVFQSVDEIAGCSIIDRDGAGPVEHGRLGNCTGGMQRPADIKGERRSEPLAERAFDEANAAPAIGAKGLGPIHCRTAGYAGWWVDQGHCRSTERCEPCGAAAKQTLRTGPYPAVFVRQFHGQMIPQLTRPGDHFRFAPRRKQKMHLTIKQASRLVAFHEMRSATHNRISCATGAAGENSFCAHACAAALSRARAHNPAKNGSSEATSFRMERKAAFAAIGSEGALWALPAKGG